MGKEGWEGRKEGRMDGRMETRWMGWSGLTGNRRKLGKSSRKASKSTNCWESLGEHRSSSRLSSSQRSVLRISYRLLMYPGDPMGSSSTSAAPSPTSASTPHATNPGSLKQACVVDGSVWPATLPHHRDHCSIARLAKFATGSATGSRKPD